MTNPAVPQGDPGETARNRVIQALSAHFAEDRLTLDEFERRVTLAYAVRTSADLDALLRDLPSSSLPVVSAPSAVPVADHAPRSKFVMAFMSGVERRGRWVAPRELHVVAFMGGFEDRQDLQPSTDPNAPLIKVTGFAMIGAVEVRVKAFGESPSPDDDDVRQQ